MKNALVLASATLALCGTTQAQGADNCANAQVISGLGPHSFNTNNATTDGPADCTSKKAHNDVWFEWTAPLTGGYIIETCGISNISTRMVIYDTSGCPGTLIACGASGCLFDTRFSFPTVANQKYLIRVGGRMSTVKGTGKFLLRDDKCFLISDDAFEENDTCSTAAAIPGDGTYPMLKVHKYDKDFYTVEVADGATVQIDTLFKNGNGNIETWLYAACGGSVLDNGGSITDDETVMWTNDTGECQKLWFEVEVFQPDPNAECNVYDMVVMGSSPPGTCGGDCPTSFYCDETQNPFNVTDISIDSCALSSSPNNVSIDNGGASNLDGQFTYLLIGNGNNTVSQPPGAKGDLCVIGGNCLGRYTSDIGTIPTSTDISNSLSGGAGYGIPTCGGNIQPGETWFFQYWHRQPMGTPASFSNAIEVTFTN